MKRFATYADNYPLQWFDLICQETLNPAKQNLQELTSEEVNVLLTRFNREFLKLQSHIKAHLMQLSSPKKIRTTVMQYHTAILLLNKQAANNCEKYPIKSASLKIVGTTLVNLTEELIRFLELRYALFIPGSNKALQQAKDKSLPEKSINFKVLCSLSADQIGLILKAADDVKLLMARSLSIIFRTIVPFLSTKRSKDPSWESMRSHTYIAEETDKEIAIQTLEAMIKKIRSY